VRHTARVRPAASELSEANRVLAVAAHDLRNPISAIIGFAEILAEEVGNRLTSFERDLVANILSTGELTLELLDSLLDMPTIQGGGDRVSNEDLVSVVNESIALNRAISASRQVPLRKRVTHPIPTVNMDRIQILGAMNQLLSNAIEVSAPRAVVEIRLRVRGRFVEIAVHDQGPRIRPEHLKELFSFPRRKDRPHERGLGMAIVKGIVDAHRGELKVSSTPGGGTVFSMFLPTQEEALPIAG
jgi:signal transduction histidine kinase